MDRPRQVDPSNMDHLRDPTHKEAIHLERTVETPDQIPMILDLITGTDQKDNRWILPIHITISHPDQRLITTHLKNLEVQTILINLRAIPRQTWAPSVPARPLSVPALAPSVLPQLESMSTLPALAERFLLHPPNTRIRNQVIFERSIS